MKVLVGLLASLVISVPLIAGTPGSFRGTVVDGPEHSDAWVYVEGRNHTIRRVEVSAAKVHYDSEIPTSDRKSPIPKVLPLGTQVRITAEQDDRGEWKATDIEILKSEPSSDPEKKLATPTTSQS
ncbi:hypothetical protein Acid345_2568 [Candidatus Koribacter versatilis Ellin345]|uniref:DUF5666 domain-containing protein n=1 Tax=Koribacter versatilis (strain Ellin345) TaxID=204669 RepID=Q1INI1_KORVE|nr:hypothetical protein [Candidatus Koribacter versatilis]ABF41569.1 hypothetical protein Acid345_2568 [Candidatus Koribacter versatilis Ellin345]